jgi:integrase
MPKLAKPLGALAVKNLLNEGLHAVGGVSGLYLAVNSNGARSWILRTKVGSKRSDIGLGSYPSISLAMAQAKATETKESIKKGIDPIAERKRQKVLVEWSFERCAVEFISLHRNGWKNEKHAQQWENTLKTYAFPLIGNKHVSAISVGDVLSVIEPNWLSKNETMNRVRNRIELILGWAAVRGYREKENPASWRGNLSGTLPKPSRVNKREAHKALPFAEMNSFMKKLRQSDGMSAKCLQWLILTATRSNEARGALWSEIDMENKSWVIPPERMKGGREHRIPLSQSALKLIQELPRFEGNDLVFQGRGDKPLSDMAMTLVMRRLKADAVPHGFRSTFVDWAAESTSYPPELREMALAHALGGKTQASYQRGDLFERRRSLMNDWAKFIDTEPSSAKVHKLRVAS